MGQNVATALAELGIAADGAGLQQEMTALDAEMSAALGSCAITYLVTAHEAFGYLADAYGFEQVGISGLSPEAQPSPAKLAEITDLVRAKGITTIYVEQLLPPDSAEAIASETGASTALLDPIEGNTDDKGYVAIMQANTQALKTGQSCS
jgi:zinc transport system substrate-binding protein